MVSLSLTAMVDMFAIMVIFLLANATTVTQWIEIGHGIQLPKAKASDPPPKAASIHVSKDMVFANNKPLLPVKQVLQSGIVLPALSTWLLKQAKQAGYINIVAHENTPYGIIRRIVFTCQQAGFKNVNLAVQPRG